MEKNVRFASEGLELEGLMAKGSVNKGAVITHPHPLYGGDMYNNVVEEITDAYRSKGYWTLRFNFRGVGGSQSRYDNGIGEQNDVLSAISYLKGNGVKSVDLAGYSFGSWINANVVNRNAIIDRLVMISPPVNFIDFDGIDALKPLVLVVTGSMDDIAPASIIREKITVWNPEARFEVIDGADHFYSGVGSELALILAEVV